MFGLHSYQLGSILALCVCIPTSLNDTSSATTTSSRCQVRAEATVNGLDEQALKPCDTPARILQANRIPHRSIYGYILLDMIIYCYFLVIYGRILLYMAIYTLKSVFWVSGLHHPHLVRFGPMSFLLARTMSCFRTRTTSCV